MDAKRISDSQITLNHIMGPQDANSRGVVHGGIVMKMVDEAGAIAAMRHAKNIVVTVFMDSMTFKEPIRIGYLVTAHATLTYVGRTSIEVRVDVIAENPVTGEKGHTNSAYVVYVALDSAGKPCEVPPLKLENETERKRWQEAEKRQAYRKRLQSREEEA